MKVTFLTVMPSPYVQDLFAQMSADARFDLRVLYMEQVAPDTYWGEQAMPGYARVLAGRWLGVSGARVHCNPTARREVSAGKPDIVVVVGYIGLTNQLVMRSLVSQGKPWVFWGEIPGLHRRGWLGNRLRGALQRPLRHAAGIAGVGSHAVTAYRQLIGEAVGKRVFCNIPYHCRIDNFQSAAWRRTQGPDVRFLYCGQLIHRKGVDLLLQAFAGLVGAGLPVTLTLAGEGPLRSELTGNLPPEVAARVTFTGFQAVTALPALFAAHDAFILPSRHDGWGVVVNQAVASGMPVIVSSAVGASHDLVEPEANGFCVRPDDVEELQSAMRRLVDSRERMAAFGKRSADIAERISLRQGVEDWHHFLQGAIAVAARHKFK